MFQLTQECFNRLKSKCWIVALLLITCGASLWGQDIRIVILNGKTGKPIKGNPFFGPSSVLSVSLANGSGSSVRYESPFEPKIDKQGVASFRLTDDLSQINVPDCTGVNDELPGKDASKDQRTIYNAKFKNCWNLMEVDHPVAKYADTITVNSLRATAGGRQYFTYVSCLRGLPGRAANKFSAADILREGIVTSNECGNATVKAEPGQLVLFFRDPTNGEAWHQAWD